MKDNEIRKNIHFERYKNFRNIKQTFNEYNENNDNFCEKTIESDFSNYKKEVKKLIENNSDFHMFLSNLYVSSNENSSLLLNELIGEKTETIKKLDDETLFLDFKNIILYANFLNSVYLNTQNSSEQETFINKTINLLANQDIQFWLEDSLTSFNIFINKIKKDEILLRDYKSYLPPNKLLWGFDEFMKKSTAESLKNHINSIKYIELIAKHEFLDTKIDEILNDNQHKLNN